MVFEAAAADAVVTHEKVDVDVDEGLKNNDNMFPKRIVTLFP